MKNHITRRILDLAFVATLLVALTQTASAVPHPMPDAGSSATLMGVACAGLAMLRKFRR